MERMRKRDAQRQLNRRAGFWPVRVEAIVGHDNRMEILMLNYKVYGMWKGVWSWVDSFASEGRAIREGKELVAYHGATDFKVVEA